MHCFVPWFTSSTLNNAWLMGHNQWIITELVNEWILNLWMNKVGSSLLRAFPWLSIVWRQCSCPRHGFFIWALPASQAFLSWLLCSSHLAFYHFHWENMLSQECRPPNCSLVFFALLTSSHALGLILEALYLCPFPHSSSVSRLSSWPVKSYRIPIRESIWETRAASNE